MAQKKKVANDEIKKGYMRLRKRSENVLRRIIKKKWIIDFVFVRDHGSFDIHGIDLFIYFSPKGNGDRGSGGVQEKTSISAMKKHFKKYPCVPAYLLFMKDSEREIEYTYLLLILKCKIFNKGKEEAIEGRLKQLVQLMKNQPEYRVGCGVWPT